MVRFAHCNGFGKLWIEVVRSDIFGASPSPLSKISDREWVGPRCSSDPNLLGFQASLSILERRAGGFGPGDGGCGRVALPQNNRGFFPGTHTN